MPWGVVAAAAISGVAAYASRPDTPDYGAVSDASRYSADLSERLGRDQLSFAQRQYDENMAIARPIIGTQQQIMQQGLSQGDELHRYGQAFRPLEQEMLAQARGGLTAADVVRMNRSGLGGLRFAQPQPSAQDTRAWSPPTPTDKYGAAGQPIKAGVMNVGGKPVAATPSAADVPRNMYSGQPIPGYEAPVDGPRNMYSGQLIPSSAGFETAGQAAVANVEGLLAEPEMAAMLSQAARDAHLEQVKQYRPDLYADYAARLGVIPTAGDAGRSPGVLSFGGGSGAVQPNEQAQPMTERSTNPVAGGLSKTSTPNQVAAQAVAAQVAAPNRVGAQAATQTMGATYDAQPTLTNPQTAYQQTPSAGGALSASQIAANNSTGRANTLASAQGQWQQGIDGRRADLTRQVEAARAEEEAIRQREISDAQARTEGLSMSYIDAQGNVRSADSYRNIAASTGQRDGSPGDGYQYFEFDNPNAGAISQRTIVGNDSDSTVQDVAPDRTGAWLRTGRVGVADPALAGATPTADPTKLRSYQLQQQLDALSAERFDTTKVDYTSADNAAGSQAMDGAMIRAMLDQQEMDQITGTAQSNADRLAARTRAYEGETQKDIQDYTGGNDRILDRYRTDINADVGRAVADARMGQTSATNAAMRQAMRYGLSVPGTVGSLTSGQASQLAAAANNTRNSAVDNYRSLVGQGIGLKRDAFSTGQAATLDSMNKGEQALRSGRDMRIQSESLDWAKKLDVTGLARGMSGASQGAYSVATNAGNSAVGNQMAPGQAMQSAMAQSANTQMTGRQIAQQGLGSVLGAQTSAYNNQLSNFTNILGTGAGAAMAYSDSRLKRNVVKLRDDPRGFGWYEFDYLWGGGRHVGVMAQEVEAVIPAAVIDIGGYKAVNYNLL